MKYSTTLLALMLLVPAYSNADAVKGKEIFIQRCSPCHGENGMGDGPVAASLPPEQKPRNLHSGPFKMAVDEAKLKDVILQGGVPFGLNPLMAPQPGLSDADLANLIEFVMSLRKQ